ncbi:hypothetical protein M422DRAFT_55284 [Sphaerobolus stellatus SS14]|uniref:Uncharacterized protein n=1 Tax=Sphaerobolus stellatus (strain SS14) TaxID=990650 RepID=A0A0C9UNA3_SPHS4|nr:hypothetical protein M422DRAFT_55284 [Sphaerobolus stellatus SS14]
MPKPTSSVQAAPSVVTAASAVRTVTKTVVTADRATVASTTTVTRTNTVIITPKACYNSQGKILSQCLTHKSSDTVIGLSSAVAFLGLVTIMLGYWVWQERRRRSCEQKHSRPIPYSLDSEEEQITSVKSTVIY